MTRLLFILTLILFGSRPGGAEGEVAVTELEWRSASQSEAELAMELSKLYLSLYNSGNLNVREVRIGKSPYVEGLVREEGVFRGAFFPVEMDALLCDINPDICSRRRINVDSRELSNVTTHVGGFAPSRGQWSTRTGAAINIPDYVFEDVTVLGRIEVPADWRAEDFVAPEGVDCSAWGDSCVALVQRFNPPTIRSSKSLKRVTVPQNKLTTTLTLKPDTASSFNEVLSQMGAAQTEKTEREFAGPEIWSATWDKVSKDLSPTDMTLDALRSNLRPVGSLQKYAVADEPYFAKQVDLFKLINHPFAGTETMPEDYTRPIGVLVIDSKLSTGHCDWSSVFAIDGTEMEAPSQPTTGNEAAELPDAGCAKIDELALSDIDHASAVGGLIGSRANGKGIVGLNPWAQMSFMEFDRNANVHTHIADLLGRVRDDIPEEIRVTNMSFGVIPLFGNFDEFEVALDSLATKVLFVAAAGNEGHALKMGACPIMPACSNKLDNVITVIGLNADLADPKPWRTSTAATNTNPDFEIGAIAESVLSTVSNNRFAHKSGTSMAAPQVSAAASLIFAAGDFMFGDSVPNARLQPKIVKDRLIYTADFFGELTKDVKAGRLNVGRSMHLRDAQFDLFDGRRVVGQVKAAPDVFTCRTPIESQKFQNWFDLRRLVFNEARQRHIVFRHIGGEPGDRYGELERYPSCNVTTQSAKITVSTRVDTGFETVEFTFADIKDYTSPLFDE